MQQGQLCGRDQAGIRGLRCMHADWVLPPAALRRVLVVALQVVGDSSERLPFLSGDSVRAAVARITACVVNVSVALCILRCVAVALCVCALRRRCHVSRHVGGRCSTSRGPLRLAHGQVRRYSHAYMLKYTCIHIVCARVCPSVMCVSVFLFVIFSFYRAVINNYPVQHTLSHSTHARHILPYNRQ